MNEKANDNIDVGEEIALWTLRGIHDAAEKHLNMTQWEKRD